MSIADLYEGRVGRGFSEEELADIFKEGAERYKNNIPPGFADLKDKKDNSHRELYGDLIIWKEIIRESKDREMPILFVTEDIKEDWWEGSRGKTVGPLPALRREFFSETGQIFHMYRVRTFIDQAGSMLNIRMNRESTDEINKRTSGDERPFGTVLVAEQDFSVPSKSYAEVAKYAIDNQLTFKEIATVIPKINYNAEEVFDSYKKELLKLWIATKKKRDESADIAQEILSQNGFDFDDPEVVRFMRREARLDAELKKIVKNMEVVGMDVEALR